MFKNSSIKPSFIAALTCLSAGILWLYVLLYKYNHFGYYDWDLAFFTQACWNILHGSQYVSLVGINYFGDHSYFITFLYLPFFALFPHPLTLVILKLAAYIISAYMLFRIFYKGTDFRIAFALMVGYLILPASAFTLLYDFNPESLAMPFIILMFDAFGRKRWVLFWIGAICLLLIKENFALVTAVFAIYGLVVGKESAQKKAAAILLAVSIITFYVLTECLIPHFRHLQTHAFVVRYAYLGSSVGEILGNIVFHPSMIFSHIFNAGNAAYMNQLFGPWLFPSLIGLPVLCVAAPLLLQHLLSSSMPEHTIYYHYGMTFAPFIFLAVYQGVQVLRNWVRISVVHISVYIILFLACLSLLDYREEIKGRVDYHPDAQSFKRWELVRNIPPDAPVIATFDFLAPLSMRKELYSFHKVFDDYYQDPKMIARSELNVQSNFVLPAHVSYALIDFNDSWISTYFRKNPAVTQKRIDGFLNGWHPVKQYGPLCLFRRNSPQEMGFKEK